MVNGKTPLYLTIVALILIGGAVLLVQPYSADFPGTDYAPAVRRYVRAALRQDSAALQAVSASPTAVKWGLEVGRTHPDSLASWAGPTNTYVTARHADTAEVLVYPVADPCSNVPIALTLVGSRSHARVVGASSACLRAAR